MRHLRKIKCSRVAGRSGTFPRDPEKSILWTHAWEIMVWQYLFGGKWKAALCPTSLHPGMEKVQLRFQQGQNKVQGPEFLVHITA